MISCGNAEILVASGMESMTNAPNLAKGARTGFRYDAASLDDAAIRTDDRHTSSSRGGPNERPGGRGRVGRAPRSRSTDRG
nr:hypothetical protein [Rhodococcus fascians]